MRASIIAKINKEPSDNIGIPTPNHVTILSSYKFSPPILSKIEMKFNNFVAAIIVTETMQTIVKNNNLLFNYH